MVLGLLWGGGRGVRAGSPALALTLHHEDKQERHAWGFRLQVKPEISRDRWPELLRGPGGCFSREGL